MTYNVVGVRAACIAFALMCSSSLISVRGQREQIVDEEDPQFTGPSFSFRCPENNGKFRDDEQCDLYYECVDGVHQAKLCPDGLQFDDSRRNKEDCRFPHEVECGTRTYLQQARAGNQYCPRENGFFRHHETCHKFWSCDKGHAYEMPCANPLIFDDTVGGCVRQVEAHDSVREYCLSLGDGSVSEDSNSDLLEDREGSFSNLGVKAEESIDGFTCPGHGVIGVNGLMQEHPIFRHPAHCRYFFVCQFGRFAQKLGCPETEVFDSVSQVCKAPEEVPDCACWMSCKDNCPGDCYSDCSCVTDEDNDVLDSNLSA